MGAPARITLATASPEDTRAVGAALAESLRAGDVASLTGDLGAGKTTLIQGICRGLGVEQPVLSPTFTLVREYDGRLHVYHLDVYRLDRIQDVLDLGFDELLDANGVVLIEWGDVIEAVLPEDTLQVELMLADDPPADPSGGGEPRTIVLTAAGRSWEARWPELRESLRPWTAPGEA